jgi:hypothetical protein
VLLHSASVNGEWVPSSADRKRDHIRSGVFPSDHEHIRAAAGQLGLEFHLRGAVTVGGLLRGASRIEQIEPWRKRHARRSLHLGGQQLALTCLKSITIVLAGIRQFRTYLAPVDELAP